MKKSVYRTPLGGKRAETQQAIETVRIEGDDMPGPEEATYGFQAFWKFVESLQTNPTLLRHSSECPTKFTISHNGRCWVVESTAIVTAPSNAS